MGLLGEEIAVTVGTIGEGRNRPEVKSMRTVCALIFLCGIVIMNIQAQTLSKSMKDKEHYSVTLRGQVESVEISQPPPSGVSIIVKLKLEIINDGVKPLIFLKENSPVLVGYALTKDDAKTFPEDRLAFSYTGPGVDTSPKWAVLRQSLDQPSPPPDKFRILMPNETWPFNDTARIVLSTEAENKNIFPKNASWEAIQKLSPVWLQVIYQAWPLNIEPPSRARTNRDRTKLTFGHKLQRQWDRYGRLWLDGLLSTPIKLNLRDSSQ